MLTSWDSGKHRGAQSGGGGGQARGDFGVGGYQGADGRAEVGGDGLGLGLPGSGRDRIEEAGAGDRKVLAYDETRLVSGINDAQHGAAGVVDLIGSSACDLGGGVQLVS
ncbi:hypothetical protein [Mycolicibacterium sp.]|uniref:hypothetical protein n=1 Tax=Mycolicibacterium sp. TaxID=2320850 RepID=UPI0028AC409A|nr:hypothetical protein [Mycolicibacterium sp.]